MKSSHLRQSRQPGAGRRAPRAVALLIGIAYLNGCAEPRSALTDDEKIVRSVLILLASNGRSVCTDDHTQENALAVYRQMTLAPRPSRAQLHWSPPTPLRPDNAVTTQQLRKTELGDDRLTIREPGARRDVLSGLVQLELDGTAKRLIGPVGGLETGVAIRRDWVPAGVRPRWWPLNRIRTDCWPLFVISNPVRDRRTAFVTVRAEHWGTLYALQNRGSDWRVMAEWSRWLY